MSRIRKTSNYSQIKMLWFGLAHILTLVFVVGMFGTLNLHVFAESDMTEKGFVEYQTTAPVDFKDIVEVKLTEKETGYYYTHHLYPVNDYLANMSIPFGTYTITASVVSDVGVDVSQYSVIVPNGDIVIQNTHSAIPILLHVDMLSGVETSEDDYSEPEAIVDEDVAEGNRVSNTEPGTEVAGEGTDVDEPSVKQKKEPSLLVSTISFLAILAIATVGYLCFKYRYLNKK